MNELYPKIEITQTEAETIARGLFAVARADGVIHPGEAALIAEFYASTTENPADLGHLERGAELQPELLPKLLPSTEIRELFIKTALLVAYTDGKCDDGEQKLIKEFANAIEIGDDKLKDMHNDVKEYLLSQLSHLQNTEATVKVAGELDI